MAATAGLFPFKVKRLTNDTWNVPQGCFWFAVYPVSTATFAIVDSQGTIIDNIDVPFASPDTMPLESNEANPIKIIASGSLNITYIY